MALSLVCALDHIPEVLRLPSYPTIKANNGRELRDAVTAKMTSAQIAESAEDGARVEAENAP
jgi:hypothetical protein